MRSAPVDAEVEPKGRAVAGRRDPDRWGDRGRRLQRQGTARARARGPTADPTDQDEPDHRDCSAENTEARDHGRSVTITHGAHVVVAILRAAVVRECGGRHRHDERRQQRTEEAAAVAEVSEGERSHCSRRRVYGARRVAVHGSERFGRDAPEPWAGRYADRPAQCPPSPPATAPHQPRRGD